MTPTPIWRRSDADASTIALGGFPLRNDKMATYEFQDIAKLLNYSRTTQIQTEKPKGKDGRWALYKGTHKVHTSTYPFRVLYLNAAVTLSDIKVALQEVGSLVDVDVVYADSIEKRLQGKEFEPLLRASKGRFTAKAYFVSFIKDEIQTYISKIGAQTPLDYIDPKVETPSGFSIKTPNPLLSFLRDPDTEYGSGKLGILLAEPGQGKTYMSRYLVSIMARAGSSVVPLMVDSTQWHSMSVEDQRALPKTIAHSFRHFGAPISWLEGHEDDFLTATLKADIFRIVFDGFDEYILRNRGSVQPLEVLDALAELAKKTGTRIVITSRTSFWNTNLPETELGEFLDRHGALIFKLCPFDLEHAKNYFRRRLKETPKIDRAVQTYQNIAKRDPEFVGRGFVLSLVADLANNLAPGSSGGPGDSGTMRWLMEALCERERLRQQLPLTAEEQVRFLSTFAAEVAEGEKPNTELLSLSMSIARPTLDRSTSASIIDKLKSHPLIEQDPSTDTWDFKQEQIKVLLLAERLVQWDGGELLRFLAKATLEPSVWQDLGESVVEILRRDSRTEDDAIGQITRFLNVMLEARKRGTWVPKARDEGLRLPWIVALATVERFLPKGSPRRDRTNLLVRLCGGSAIQSLSIRGTIARFDFAGTVFQNCKFDRVGWVSCLFNQGTAFVNCEIVGGAPPIQCEGFGSIMLSDTTLDPDAEAILNSVRVHEGRRKYGTDDLRRDIHSVIEKFVIRGGLGLKTVEEGNLGRGPISTSRFRDEVLDTLRSMLLEEHHISGGSAGYNVRKDSVEAVKFYGANNVFTGKLRDAFERLERKLGLK
jgi:hypothetical protein